ncbi:hypothetical protein CRYUN_Cryun10bG0092100 [Craigia yunnanensis]
MSLMPMFLCRRVVEIPEKTNLTGGEPLISDAYTINGQPGYLYPCSKKGTYKMMVEQGKRYILWIINAVMDENMFFAIAKHKLTLVGKDGFYIKPFTTYYLMITPGVIHTSRSPLPNLPPYNRTQAATDFTKQFRSLASKSHPAKVPLVVDTHFLYTISVNLHNCGTEKPCAGPFGKRFASIVNNRSFITPKIDILQAYYYGIKGLFEEDFPRKPPHKFNYTDDNLSENLLTPSFGTKVLVLEYKYSVELIFQGTNVLASDNHPVHLHGYCFYIVGRGFRNFNPKTVP